MKPQISIIALFLLISACGNGAENGNGDNENARTTPVYVQELKLSEFRHYVNVQGDVESDKTIMITPKTTATVEEILVRAGDDVQKGDILARLDGEITRSQIQEVETQLELAETLYKRQQNLREQNIGSEVEFLQAKTQYESARNQLNTLTEQYENYTIRATISGTVDRVDLKVGEMASPTIAAFQLTNTDALKVTAQVSEAYITRIEQTDSVEITFPSLDETIRKQLDVVSKAINPSNRTFGLEIYISNESGTIRPNMMARVSINDITLNNQIVVPVNSVQIANNLSYVFVAENTESGWVARNREVTRGYNYGNNLVIEEGLNDGELLVTGGYANLSDGAAISIQEN
ncbi:efflux RND transporter periplasmic adaptor subunit [Rhodohalobacter sulfatireducens]|uniref:Efflux RND transporter periplasmic adaptor subunit n=1 Tax=Rhodohalobacter sulfatireducens TaxID=2911366 RepID=A0ABS9KG78_9BACT|nr:efflux RND transporter periplasmic adaptor subunit [Rhodohalobacter sulfatireducens]MCG2589854.1 efflux RND transporter periplasmic adaptor subunit [Rhodohalobacter sulfatireducens]